MKECRMPLSIFEQYRTSVVSFNKKQLNTLFRKKLIQAGFDMDKKVSRFKDLRTNEFVIQQPEKGDRGYNGT